MILNRRSMLQGLSGAALLSRSRNAFAQDSADWQLVVAAAKKEGRLRIVTPSTSQVFQDVVASFRKTYGIDANILVARVSEVRERIRIAKVAGRSAGDVMFSSFAQTSLLDGEDKTIAPLPAVPSAHLVTAALNGAPMAPVMVLPFGILVNTKLVPDGEEPRSWKDLALPHWKGKFLLDLTSAGGPGYLWFYLMFKQFGREFCEQVAAQVPEFSQTPQEAERRVARGEFPLYVPLQMPNILKLKGLPVRGLIMDEGAPYTVYGNSVLDLAENQNAARIFLEYCLSQDVQMMFARDGYGISIPDFLSAVPEDMRWLSNAKLMGTIDPWQEREMRAEAVKIFGR